MPLTDFQAEVLRCIAANRTPDSYIAGATVLHGDERSPRFSQDLDIFHDLEESIALSAETDATGLREAGYTFSWVLRTPTFYRAVVAARDEQAKMEWAHDSAFRFFPVLEDKRCGYRLHQADAAVNKVLALAGRQEVRDYVDVLYLHETYLSLGAMAWAACGKDPGFTPEFLLDQAGRHVAYTQADVDRLNLSGQLDVKVLKKKWLTALESARELVSELPAEELGCLYLDADDTPVTPPANPNAKPEITLKRHRGCIRGAWPSVQN